MAGINLRQNINTHFAFSVMLILSFLLAWYTLHAAEKLVGEAKDSAAFDAGKRMEKMKNNPQK